MGGGGQGGQILRDVTYGRTLSTSYGFISKCSAIILMPVLSSGKWTDLKMFDNEFDFLPENTLG